MTFGPTVLHISSVQAQTADSDLRQKIRDTERELVTTKEILEGEKQRVDALEKKLAELKGKESESTPEQRDANTTGNTKSTPVDNASDQGIKFISIPEHSITGLGFVSACNVRLAGPVRGARLVRVSMPKQEGDAPRILSTTDTTGATVTFACRHPQSGEMKLASLSVKNENLCWSWNSFSPDGIMESVKQLEAALSSSLVEVCADNQVLARYQATPKTVEVALSLSGVSKATLPVRADSMRLAADPKMEKWGVTPNGDYGIDFSSDPHVLTLKLDPTACAVEAGLTDGTPRSVHLKEIDNELAEWRKDLANEGGQETERKPVNTNPRRRLVRPISETLTADPTSPEATNSQTARIKSHIEKLEAEKKKILAEPSAENKSPPDVAKCGALVVRDNGVILCRITFRLQQ